MANPICPLCETDEHVYNVKYLIESNTEVTTGVALGMGGTSFSNLGLGGGVTASRTVTGIARRLLPPPMPGRVSTSNQFLAMFVYPLCAAILFAYLLFPDARPEPGNWTAWIGFYLIFGGLMAFPAIIIGMPLGWLGCVLYEKTQTKKQWDWNVRTQHLFWSYYCTRDDIIFNDVKWGYPDDFKEYIFTEDLSLGLHVHRNTVD